MRTLHAERASSTGGRGFHRRKRGWPGGEVKEAAPEEELGRREKRRRSPDLTRIQSTHIRHGRR